MCVFVLFVLFVSCSFVFFFFCVRVRLFSFFFACLFVVIVAFYCGGRGILLSDPKLSECLLNFFDFFGV